VVVTFRIRHSQARCTVDTAVCLCLSLSVCLSLAAFLHYCTDPDVTSERMVRGAPSCVLLGRFAIGARVSLLWQHTRLMRNVGEDGCSRSMSGSVVERLKPSHTLQCLNKPLCRSIRVYHASSTRPTPVLPFNFIELLLTASVASPGIGARREGPLA